MPETSFNNRLAQRPKGKQKRFIIEFIDLGVFVSQAHNVSGNFRRQKFMIELEAGMGDVKI
jgi:hypothetical protein